MRERNLFTAHEIAQMVPLRATERYARFIDANRWAQDYLPTLYGDRAPTAPTASSPASRPGLLSSRPFAALERWEMRRKIRRLSARAAREGGSLSFSEVECRGHFAAHDVRVLAAYAERVGSDRRTAGMTDVLFGQSYYLRFDPKLQEAMQPYPPLGTLYAASYVRARGYDVALFDAMLAASENEWSAALDRTQPRYAVLYEDNFNYLSKMCLLAHARGGRRDDRRGPRARLHGRGRWLGRERQRRLVPGGGRGLRDPRRGRGDAGRAARSSARRRTVGRIRSRACRSRTQPAP